MFCPSGKIVEFSVLQIMREPSPLSTAILLGYGFSTTRSQRGVCSDKERLRVLGFAGPDQTNEPMTSAGIGIFNKQRNRWDHVDFRVAGILESHSPPTEIKSDFSVIYRVSDSRPNWPDK